MRLGLDRPGIRPAGVIVFVVALAVAVALTRGDRAHMAARVGGTTISAEEVDLILAHARDEAKNEGNAFPARGTPAYQAFRRQALGLLVYHEELAQQAVALGIEVPAADLAAPGVEGESGSGEADGGQDAVFVRQSVRGAALYRKIYDQVTRSASVSDAEVRQYYQGHLDRYRALGVRFSAARQQIRLNLLDTKRNAAMARWIARMKRDYAVRQKP